MSNGSSIENPCFSFTCVVVAAYTLGIINKIAKEKIKTDESKTMFISKIILFHDIIKHS